MTLQDPYTSGLINRFTIESLLELQDKQFLKELIDVFVQEIPNNLSALKQFYGKKDETGMRDVLHKMKGSCGSIGADQMLKTIKEIQDLVKSGNIGKTSGMLQDLEQQSQNTIRAIKSALQL